MRRLLQAVGWVALLGTIVPSLLYLRGGIEHPLVNTVMAAATLLWFATAPWWMERQR